MKIKRKQENKLSKKLILAFVGALVMIVMAVTLVGSIVLMPFGEKVQIQSLYISQLLIVVLVVMAFCYIIEKMIVRRIRRLSDAMKKVAKGNYEIAVPVEEHDELSGLTDSFNKMAAELKSNAFLSRDFTRYVSHEFKTPLTVIRSYAEAAQDAEAKEEVNEYMKVIIEETDRLAGISQNILALCRLDSTTILAKEDVFSPATQIRTILLSAQFAWNSKNITIEPELEEFEVRSNESLLFRIWENLIGNAVKFTRENGHIAITLKKQGSELFFSVRDDGIGIADEDKGHIFNPFFTGDKSHNKEGSGLGLPLIKAITEKLGGTVRFTSEINRGSTFMVRIPL